MKLSSIGKLVALSLAISTSAFAATSNDTVSLLNNNISKTNIDMQGKMVEKDAVNEQFMERTGGKFQLVTAFGRSFVVISGDIDTLYDPTGIFMIEKDGFQRASDVITEISIKGSSAVWPSLKVKEGVAKTGDIYVFSDPTCGYCQKLDSETEQYLDAGIEVHYIPWPRSGLNPSSPAFVKWAQSLCADEPAKAYNEISLGKDLGKYAVPTDLNASCTALIKEGYDLGVKLGVQGTPYIFAESLTGKSVVIPGYNPANAVITAIK